VCVCVCVCVCGTVLCSDVSERDQCPFDHVPEQLYRI